jgi:hypothetical protein
MLTVENTPENTGRARKELARLALKNWRKKIVNRLTNQSIS